jgi:hypothetical protein
MRMELTLDTLALLQKSSPLSRMIVDGAGLPYRPREVTVVVDGVKAWTAKCGKGGTTDNSSADRKHAQVPMITVGDLTALGMEGGEARAAIRKLRKLERITDNRAVAEYREHRHELGGEGHGWANDVAEDLLEAAGRPSFGPPRPPRKPEAEPALYAGEAYPCPEPCVAKGTVLGLPYRQPGSYVIDIGPLPTPTFRPIGF